MLLYYSRRGELPLGKISDRLQVHRASVTNVVDKLATAATSRAFATAATAGRCSQRSPPTAGASPLRRQSC